MTCCKKSLVFLRLILTNVFSISSGCSCCVDFLQGLSFRMNKRIPSSFLFLSKLNGLKKPVIRKWFVGKKKSHILAVLTKISTLSWSEYLNWSITSFLGIFIPKFLNSLTTNVPHHRETSQSSGNANQLFKSNDWFLCDEEHWFKG